jgi:hypothetical protein
MIYGLFSDPRIWNIDYVSSSFWAPEKYGVHIDLHTDAFRIPELGIDNKYSFFITSEVWEIPMRKSLEYIRTKGIPIFLIPREILPTEAHAGIMFNCNKYFYNNEYYFKPDMLLAPSESYAKLWSGVKKEVIGYPRFDSYACLNIDKSHILKKYGLDERKIIFFPSYPPYQAQTIDGNHIMVDLYKDLNATIEALEYYSKNADNQVVIKIHPMAQKCYNKKIGRGNEVDGLMEKYYLKPTKNMRVIGDDRMNGNISRELLMISDFVIGFTSVMLLEAINQDKPTIHMLFDQASQLKGNATYADNITTVRNPKELLLALNSDHSKYIVKDKSIVEKYLYKIDGKFCERMCNAIKVELGKP